MALSVVPYRAWYLKWLQDKGVAEGGGLEFTDSQRHALQEHPGWVVLNGEEPIAAGGLVRIWPGRWSAWMYMTKDTAPYMLFITRAARERLKAAKGRIEMTTQCLFEPGHRWAKLLGFRLETPRLEAYGPDGEAHSGYARIN